MHPDRALFLLRHEIAACAPEPLRHRHEIPKLDRTSHLKGNCLQGAEMLHAHPVIIHLDHRLREIRTMVLNKLFRLKCDYFDFVFGHFLILLVWVFSSRVMNLVNLMNSVELTTLVHKVQRVHKGLL